MSHRTSVSVLLVLGALLLGSASLAQVQSTLLEPGPTLYHQHPRFLSFSPDDAFVVCGTHAPDWFEVLDMRTGEKAWDWHYPELLATSLGDLIFSPCYYAREWHTPNPLGGWPGTVTALFRPKGEPQLAVAHSVHMMDELIAEDEQGTRFLPGVWELGSYIHRYEGTDFHYVGTAELEPPRRLPRDKGLFTSQLAAITALQFSPDGSLLATADSHSYLTFWSDRTSVGQVQVDRKPLLALAFSPKGDLIATIGDSGIVRVFTVKELQLVAEFAGHTAEGCWIAFTPDGSRVVSAALDRTVRLWNVKEATAAAVIPLPPELGVRQLFTFAGNGGWVYAVGNGKPGAVFGQLDLTNGRFTELYHWRGACVRVMTCSPSGYYLALAEEKGKILTWHLAPPADVPEP